MEDTIFGIEALHADVRKILSIVQQIQMEEKKEMATLADLDAALQANDAALQSLASAMATLSADASTLLTDVQALAAKANPDFSSEVSSLQNQAAALADALNSVNAAVANVVAADHAAGGSEQ